MGFVHVSTHPILQNHGTFAGAQIFLKTFKKRDTVLVSNGHDLFCYHSKSDQYLIGITRNFLYSNSKIRKKCLNSTLFTVPLAPTRKIRNDLINFTNISSNLVKIKELMH